MDDLALNISGFAIPVSVASTTGVETHPALTAGCTGNVSAGYTAYMHLAYNYDEYQQLLLNPGFESGDNGNWQRRVAADISCSGSNTHTGTCKALLGGLINFPSWPGDWIYQQVTIPAGATSAQLSFWLMILSSDSTTTPYDYFYADVRDGSGNLLQNLVTLSNANQGAYGSYHQLTYDLSAYIGQTVRIYFWATNDVSLTTSFYVDDTALTAPPGGAVSEIRYANAAHPGTAYPTGLASFAKLAVLATYGTPAWPYGPPAIAASHGGSATISSGREVA